VPFAQLSPIVHSLPSLQDVPAGFGVCVQPVDGLQPSAVHAFPSSQFGAAPP
jgi:hypothetical protein